MKDYLAASSVLDEGAEGGSEPVPPRFSLEAEKPGPIDG